MSTDMQDRRVRVVAVRTDEDRAAALAVIDEVFRDEKGWIAAAEAEIPSRGAASDDIVWFLARSGAEPVGVLRLVVDPALAIPENFGLCLEPGVDLQELASRGRFAEVGRLMVRRAWRARPRVVIELMRAALSEGLERGVSQLLTAVFEDDPHSPLQFHERHLGFVRMGSHERGELACASRRILLRLDLAEAFVRLGRQRGVASEIARGLEGRLVGLASSAAASSGSAFAPAANS